MVGLFRSLAYCRNLSYLHFLLITVAKVNFFGTYFRSTFESMLCRVQYLQIISTNTSQNSIAAEQSKQSSKEIAS